jgi:RNA polymerase sigma-70 factor (ECF subfamily)
MVKQELLVRLLVSERVKVLAFIRSMVRRYDLAEDIFQDICVLAIEKQESIRDEAHFLNWMRTVARLRSLNVLRQQGLRHLSLDDDLLHVLEVAWEGHDQDDSEVMAAAIRRCVDSLAPTARGLIHRRYVDKAKYPDLAKELNRPVVSLYTTFSRIYAVLADCVARQLSPEGGEHA